MLRNWNPLDRMKGGFRSEIPNPNFQSEIKKIEDEECRKIQSLSGFKLFKYAEYVKTSSPINRSFGFYYFMFCRFSKNRWTNSDAEAMVKTIKSILLCLRSRLQGMILTRRGRSKLVFFYL